MKKFYLDGQYYDLDNITDREKQTIKKYSEQIYNELFGYDEPIKKKGRPQKKR